MPPGYEQKKCDDYRMIEGNQNEEVKGSDDLKKLNRN